MLVAKRLEMIHVGAQFDALEKRFNVKVAKHSFPNFGVPKKTSQSKLGGISLLLGEPSRMQCMHDMYQKTEPESFRVLRALGYC